MSLLTTDFVDVLHDVHMTSIDHFPDELERLRRERRAAMAADPMLFARQVNDHQRSAPRTAPAPSDPGDSELRKTAERVMLWLSVIGVTLLTGIAVTVCLLV